MEVEGSAVRLIAHQRGLLGCRVGEASNLGPVQTRSAKLRTSQLDSDPEQVVRSGRYALLSGNSSEDGGPTVRMPGSSTDLRGRDVRVDSVCGQGGVRNSARKRLRLCQASTVVAPLESVVDALERDLSHPSHEADDCCEDISVGDVRDCTGVAVVQRAVDAQSHQCARVAKFVEAQTRPSRRLVLVDSAR